MIVNINDWVYVKLLPTGFDILRKDHDEFWNIHGMHRPPYVDPHVDDEGYTRFQIWDFMFVFGKYMKLGKILPFDGDIKIGEIDK